MGGHGRKCDCPYCSGQYTETIEEVNSRTNRCIDGGLCGKTFRKISNNILVVVFKETDDRVWYENSEGQPILCVGDIKKEHFNSHFKALNHKEVIPK